MRQELWNARADRIKQCAYMGMTLRQVVADTGLNIKTVRTYSERYGIPLADRKGGGGAERHKNDLLRLSEEGVTLRDAARELGLAYPTASSWARSAGIKFHHPGTQKSSERADAMVAMFSAGKTLNEIGQIFGITRERVRQLIKKYHGLSAEDGGQAVRAKVARSQRRALLEAECYRKHGCSIDQLRNLRKISREQIKNGVARERTTVGAFRRQRASAKQRGIEWEISLWDWWTIWQASGKWNERGRGAGAYVMCRFGDTGPYKVGNVYIASHRHNISVQPNNPYRRGHPDFDRVMAEKYARTFGSPKRAGAHKVYKGLPLGVTVQKTTGRFQAQCRGKYLGTFGNPEEAHAAYLAYANAPREQAAADDIERVAA
jgi:DNA-binding transcriptional MerR regulator